MEVDVPIRAWTFSVTTVSASDRSTDGVDLRVIDELCRKMTMRFNKQRLS